MGVPLNLSKFLTGIIIDCNQRQDRAMYYNLIMMYFNSILVIFRLSLIIIPMGSLRHSGVDVTTRLHVKTEQILTLSRT